VSFTNNASYNTFNLKHDALAPIQSGNWYRLKFSIVSPMYGEVLAGFKGQSQLSGPAMEGARYIPFDGQRRDVELIFQSTITDQGYCSFTNHYTEGIYNIDNIKMEQVQVVPLDPLDKQQLFVNDQATALTVTLSGCWSDVSGGLHSGTIVIPPFSSVVLVKEDDSTCISTGAEDLPSVAFDGSAAAFHPNPVLAGERITLAASTQENWSLQAFDLNGKRVWAEPRMAPGATVQVPAHLLQGTYLLLLDDGVQTIRQKLMVL
jgi:hypothetical protein